MVSKYSSNRRTANCITECCTKQFSINDKYCQHRLSSDLWYRCSFALPADFQLPQTAVLHTIIRSIWLTYAHFKTNPEEAVSWRSIGTRALPRQWNELLDYEKLGEEFKMKRKPRDGLAEMGGSSRTNARNWARVIGRAK
jgi:hypothetical protein